MSPKEVQISQGRSVVTGVVASYCTATLLTVLFGRERFDSATNIATFIISNSLTVWLFYAMWTGRHWARWTISALFAVGVIIVLITTFNDFNWKLGLFIVYQASLPVLLCFSVSVDTFIDDQKVKREMPNHSPEPTPGAVH